MTTDDSVHSIFKRRIRMARLSELLPDKKDAIFFLLKFSEMKWLDKLQSGNVYMQDIKTFVEMEKKQKKKGQGDNTDGTLVMNNIKSIKLTMIDKKTNEILEELEDPLELESISIRLDHVQNRPVFCTTAIDGTFLEVIDENENEYITKLVFTDEQKNRFIEEFSPNGGLLIRPKIFLEKLSENGTKIFAKKVKYFDFSKDHPEVIKAYKNKTIDICFFKDNFFSYQSEYRILNLSEDKSPLSLDIGDMKEYSFMYTIEDLFKEEIKVSCSK